MPRFAVILPAAGSSTRFGGPRSKLIEELNGMPIITRAVMAFVQRPDVHQILIAAPNDVNAFGVGGGVNGGSGSGVIGGVGQTELLRGDQPLPAGRVNELWQALSRDASVKNRLGGQIALVPGGANRAESVLAALKRVPADIEWVAIHDAARPLVSQDVINRTLAAAIEHGAAAPAVAVQLTVKQATGPLPARVEQTVPRSQLWAMQTPQIIRRDVLLDAFESCVYPLELVTDDLQLLELAGKPTWLVPGDESNLKITTPQDMLLAELLIRRFAPPAIQSM